MIFEKWHGIGNDFVLLGSVPGDLDRAGLADLAIAVCRRTFGIGADGLLLDFDSDRADARMVMLNPDGTEAEMCGNGLRCFARWFHDETGGSGQYQIETGAGVLSCRIEGDLVAVEMGRATVLGDGFPTFVELGGRRFESRCVNMGNPHLVVFLEEGEEVPLEKWGPELEVHPAFPERSNVHFLSQVSEVELRQLTWERGAGVTLACGTGACACAVAARDFGWVTDRSLIHLPGGDLVIELSEMEVTMTGGAERTFRGRWLGKRGCWPDED